MRHTQRACLRASLALAVVLGLAAPARAQTLLYEAFSYPDGVITNEFAFDNPTLSTARKSSLWEVTNGTLFASGGAGWTGVPDDKAPNAGSTTGNSSSAFRLRTIRQDFGSVSVAFRLLSLGLNSSASTPAVAWDGAHVQVRYVSEYQLYALSVNRRDNKLVIKKKVPGGPSNGGTYYDLTPGISYAVPYGQWQTVKVNALDNSDGSVTLELWINGTRRAQVRDDGKVGGAPIRISGRVGLRGDNANLKFDDFTVTSLAGSTGDTTAPVISGVGSTNVGTGSADIVWTTGEASDSQVEYGLTTAYGTFSTLLTARVTSHRAAITGLQAGRQYYYRVLSRDAAGNLRIGDGLTHGFVTKSSGDTTPPIVLSAGSTNVRATSADIVWTTNEASDSQVEYGLTSAYGILSYLGTAQATSHKISLSNLRSGTRYYYRVRSRDAAGNLRVDTVVHAFTTPSLTAAN